ncbi:uncharacterized protein M6G45_016228 isoform 3-T3 [Spheniscus humboldti]
MGEEQPPAAAAKLFGGPAETCEEKIQSHLRSLRKCWQSFWTGERAKRSDAWTTWAPVDFGWTLKREWQRGREKEKEKHRMNCLITLRSLINRIPSSAPPAPTKALCPLPEKGKKFRSGGSRAVSQGWFVGFFLSFSSRRRAKPSGAASGPSSSGCAGSWRRRSARCWGGWRSWTPPSKPPRRKNLCGWPRGSRGSTGSSGSWRPSPCPSWSEPRLHLPSGLPAELEKSLSSCRRQRAALREALEEFRGMGRPETKPGTRNCPSTEEKAKAPPEPGTAPLPQLLADRKSVRWDEEERDGAGEPRRGQEPATPGRCRTRTR